MDLEVDADGLLWGVRQLGTDENAFCALTWSDEVRLPGHAGEAAKRVYETGQAWRRWLERGKFPDHRWRGRAAALGADPEGTHVRADRRHGRGADDVAARVAGRGAQLGLPLHVDPRRDLHALGAARARPRRRGPRLHGLRPAGDCRRRRPAPDHVRDRRRGRPHREHPRPPPRLPRLATGPDRQRRLLAAPERRLRGAARLGLHPLDAPSAASATSSGGSPPSRSRRRSRSGSSPTRASGRPAASRSTTCPRS